MRVPYSDLYAEYHSMKQDIDCAIQKVIESTAFSGGPYVDAFEQEFAAHCDCETAIGVGSGTEALWLTLLAKDIGPGDEVITVANTFVATVEAILMTGAKPVLVDVDERTYNIRPDLIAGAVTSRTKAVIPVHLYGQMADMDAVCEVAYSYGLAVIEDACQAHGAEWRGRRAGSFGNAACFSFYPGKNLGAYGEAGAITTNDMELADKIRQLRSHGQSRRYIHAIKGWNARMDGIQAAILSIKLKRLDIRNAARARNAAFYNDAFNQLKGVITPIQAKHAMHVYHVYCLRTTGRDYALSALKETGIECAIHYPVPIHMQDAYRDLGYSEGDFPTAEICASQALSLPAHPDLTPEQMMYVTEQFTRVHGISERRNVSINSHLPTVK